MQKAHQSDKRMLALKVHMLCIGVIIRSGGWPYSYPTLLGVDPISQTGHFRLEWQNKKCMK